MILTPETLSELIKEIETLSQHEMMLSEDDLPEECFMDGNDGYYAGFEDGEIGLAKRLWSIINPE